METILKLSPIISSVAIALLLLFVSCKKYKAESGSKAHQEAVQLHQLSIDLYNVEQNLVSDMQKAQSKMRTALEQNAATNAAEVKTALEHSNLIAKCIGILKKHSLLLEQQKQYISKHENTAIAAAEIMAQHQQINDNYFTIKVDAKYIKDQFDKMNSGQTAATLTE